MSLDTLFQLGTAASTLYTLITKPTPLSLPEQAAYSKMCEAYKKHILLSTANASVPTEWQLDTNKGPMACSSFLQTHDTLLTQLKVNENSILSLSSPIECAIQKIAKLFESFSERSTFSNMFKGTIRNDGVETMFFTELAM